MGKFSGKKCRLLTMFGLTVTFFVVEITVGHVTNSMALISDSFHMLSDIAALSIAFLSVRMAPKSWDKNTYGWARAEVLGRLIHTLQLHISYSGLVPISHTWYISYFHVRIHEQKNNAVCQYVTELYF